MSYIPYGTVLNPALSAAGPALVEALQQRGSGGGSDRMGDYAALGAEVAQLQAMMQAQMAALQTQGPATVQGGGGDRALALQSSPLTHGFDMDWLSQRLAAGSANGATLGGGSGFGGLNSPGKTKKKA